MFSIFFTIYVHVYPSSRFRPDDIRQEDEINRRIKLERGAKW